jgi:hypothetical protein
MVLSNFERASAIVVRIDQLAPVAFDLIHDVQHIQHKVDDHLL